MATTQSANQPMLTGSMKDTTKGNAHKTPPTAAEIQTWLVSYLAELLEKDPKGIEATIPFDRYGLDSSAAVAMTCDLEDWLGREIDPTVPYDHPTVEALARYLAEAPAKASINPQV